MIVGMGVIPGRQGLPSFVRRSRGCSRVGGPGFWAMRRASRQICARGCVPPGQLVRRAPIFQAAPPRRLPRTRAITFRMRWVEGAGGSFSSDAATSNGENVI